MKESMKNTAERVSSIAHIYGRNEGRFDGSD